MDTASVGLVRRVENMVGDTPHYRDELNRRHGHALTRIAELEAVADEPFEHTDTLRDKRHRLDTLTAALQMSADSPEAKAKETEHQQRMSAQGREAGWSLALNPTPGPARGVRGRGAGPPRGTRRRWLGYPGVGGCRGGCGTRRPGGGTGVIGGAEGGPVGLFGSGQSEHRADRAGGGCAGTPPHPTAARGPVPRRGPRPVSRGRRFGLSRSGCGRLRRGVGVLAPYGGVFGAGCAGAGCLRRSESGVAELLCGPPSG